MRAGAEADRVPGHTPYPVKAASDGVEALAKPGRPAKDQGGKGAHSTISKGTTHAAYLIAKLKRDHPDVAKRLAKGERSFPLSSS